MKSVPVFACLFVLVLSGCSTLKPDSFAKGAPALDPVKFFTGHSHSAGVLENRAGKPSERITTKTSGVYANSILTINQDLQPEKGKQSHRIFTIQLIDAHHVKSTATDIAGNAYGELYGNYFTWHYKLQIAKKGLVKHVNMTQYMYLMPDGYTLIVRSIVRKFGIKVKQITEQFHKDD